MGVAESPRLLLFGPKLSTLAATLAVSWSLSSNALWTYSKFLVRIHKIFFYLSDTWELRHSIDVRNKHKRIASSTKYTQKE